MKTTVALDTVSDGDVVVLRSAPLAVAPAPGGIALAYATRTGALLRVDGVVRGAFDREHPTVALPTHVRGDVTLEVERRALPSTGLPSGAGWRWTWMLANAVQTPASQMLVSHRAPVRAIVKEDDVPLVGHSHLDVAWLWTYAEAARKAMRTFATAVRQLEADASFVFTQSQPQLYAWVAERDPAFFQRVLALARAGRFDTSGAALWVEPDCNLPSGESLVRQLTFGIRFVESNVGTRPTVAWLPDSFGFANTLPTLLRHAGIAYFGTTKLGWNDTTAFPHARFAWLGPDGSRVVAAQIESIAGDLGRARVRRARLRGDVVLVGHGDGGGGARDAAVVRGRAIGRWTTLGAWFADVARDADALPIVRDELYLQEHRGTYTTHHDVKARNAALERSLAAAELALAWATALHATPFFLDEARVQLGRAWEIVLRAQFHDVLPGSAIADVYADAHRDYDEADALVAHVYASARSVLPRSNAIATPQPVAPTDATRRRGLRRVPTHVLRNAAVVAHVDERGAIVALHAPDGPNLVRDGLRLAAYVDRPRRWDAWNLDRSYRTRPLRVRVTGVDASADAVEVRYAFGRSLAVARVSLDRNDGYVRVDLAVDWRERHVVLRVENTLAFAASRARFGSPHGTVERAPQPRTRAERAKYEMPGQRFARVDGRDRGLAVLALDSYGWSIDRERGVTTLGHSLLRGPTWPDPSADAGTHAFALGFAPATSLGIGEIETMWDRFAGRDEVPMFTAADPALHVVATKLADDGDGVIVRVRECDGEARTMTLRCGARVRDVACVDALEAPVDGVTDFVDGAIVAPMPAFGLRAFRVRVA
ncbi:MAG: hypothetical protein NVS3B17_02360 [Vulcanimicrobiaceae bacterium]